MLHRLLYLCSIFVFISTKSYKNESFLSRFKYFFVSLRLHFEIAHQQLFDVLSSKQ